MGQDNTQAGMTKAARHVHGPRPVSAVLPSLTRAAFRRGNVGTRILLDWSVIVGPALAAMTEPRRFAQGTLTIACSGPVAMELQYMASEVMDRVNAYLGSRAVTALRFTQVHAARTEPPRPIPPARRAPEAARKAVADLPEGPLRDALEALGSAVLAPRAPARRPR